MARILEGLTPDQAAAVIHGEGPLLIVAGAGTGKTTVITRRIAHLVAAKRARPSEVLALTFTDKAAEEMEGRVDLLVPYGFADMWISTFHAFGDRVLREEGLALGLSTDFRVLTRAEQVVFLREHLFELPLQRLRPLGDPTRHLQALVTLFSRAKDEAVTPEEYLVFAAELAGREAAPEDAALQEEAALHQELAACYREYQRLLGERGLVDFGDQVLLCLRLFREHPLILQRYRERFRYILVDEFQDTNHTQWELVRLLAGPAGNITVVGDDDQSIYKFRGAAISNILGFTAAYSGARRIVLQDNFRSSQAILDAAYRLIRHNDPDRLEVRERIDKRLVATGPEGPPPRHLHSDTASSEADGVARLIAGRVEAGAWAYRDVAILVRANRDADPFLRAMNLLGVPWRFSGNQGLYARPEVRLLIAFLRVVADPEDTVSLYFLAGSELYEMDDWQLALCASAAKRGNRSLRWIFENLDTVPTLGDLDATLRATADRLVKDLKEFVSLARERSTGEVLYQFLMKSGLLKRLTAGGTAASDARVGNIARFFEIVHRFADVASPPAGVPQFIQHLGLLVEGGDDPAAVEADEDADAVNVLTVHKAKGLEFPVVFLVRLVADRFPARGRREPLPLPDALLHDLLPGGDFHLQEERRLFYVGMTRAGRELFLTSARDYGGARAKKVSRFVLEALDLPPAEPVPYKASALETIQRHAPLLEEGAEAFRVIPDDEILSLSHYQVDDYLTCPLKYKYIHVLRVPIREHHSVVYGKALHEAISFYLRRTLARAQPAPDGPRPGVSEEEVLAAFEAAWQSVGFLSREHEDLRLKEGRAVLQRFVAEEERKGVVPTAVERPFAFLLETTKVVGRWDRVNEEDGHVAIIDYKSSAVRDQKEADKKARESLQLAIYALAYEQMHGRIPDAVELHFLETGLVGSARKTEADLEKTRATIGAVAGGIRAREFTATPGYIECGYCAFREICPSTAYREAE
ncbi:MAG: ATP-dependent helicase [candidate division NC10 bacterium]|nr:ATP-dependent helicase [candidate division NC10 bacterium]